MTNEAFLKLLLGDGFPEPIFVVREGGGFLDSHSHPLELKALVTEGQIDIVIAGIKNSYLAGDVFHLLANQVHSESYGGKGVKYLASRKGMVLQDELTLDPQGEDLI
jgi:hypothetical protein